MAATERKKLLKEPDEFITTSNKVLLWAKGNLKLVIMGAAVLVVAVAVILGIRAYRANQAQAAAAQLAPLTEQYLAVVAGVDKKADLAALESGLQKVVDEYGSTLAAQRALLSLGDLYFREAKYDQAVKAFQVLVEEMDTPPSITQLARHGWGQCLEAKKDYLGAAQAYQLAVQAAGPNLGRLYSLDLARVLAAAGDKDQAVELYKKVLSGNPDQVADQEARFQMALLGVAAPPPAAPMAPAAAN